MDGEKDAMEGTAVKYFSLVAERAYKEGSAGQVHFRLAESQFYRLLSGGQGTGYATFHIFNGFFFGLILILHMGRY